MDLETCSVALLIGLDQQLKVFRDAHKVLLSTYKHLAMEKEAKLEEGLLTRMDAKARVTR